MAKTNFSEVSAAAFVIEDQPGQDATEVEVAAAVASTHKVAIEINGTTYYILLSDS